jgi:hypothetical protein
MKKQIPTVHWPTKFKSNFNYIQEVCIDGKKTDLFNSRIGFYELYVPQVMRIGNCLTLLTSSFNFSLQAFKNINLFEDIAKYVFWTFNKGFLIQLNDFLMNLSAEELKRIQNVLVENLVPYERIAEDEPDEELIWCVKKNNNLKKDHKFSMMYEKDSTNRKEVLCILNNCISEKEKNTTIDIKETRHSITPARISFLEMLVPIDERPEKTLELIKDSLEMAGAKHDIFLPPVLTVSNKKSKGFNGTVAAMICFFYESKLFKSSFSKEEVLEAFLTNYKIEIPKYKGNFNFFNEDYYFKTLKVNLKRLKLDPFA